MDLPNVTLFIQIVNFYIAYRVLYVFIFAPVLKILVAQDLKQNAVQKEIDQCLIEYNHTVIKQKNSWHAIKNRLYLLMPDKISVCWLGKSPFNVEINPIKPLSNQQKEKIVSKVSQELLDIKS